MKSFSYNSNGGSLRAAVVFFSFFLASALFSSLLAAQTPTPDKLATLIDDHYNRLNSLRASFTESYEGLGMHRVERGTLTLAKPGRMRWTYSDPKGKLFLIDGKYAWFWTEGAAQVERMSAQKLDDMRTPLRFLLGHTRIEKELAALTVRPVNGGLYELSGKTKSNSIAEIRIRATATGIIRALEIEQQDGSLTKFDFGSEEPNIQLSDAEFTFTPPAHVPIVDAAPPI